MSIEEDVRTSCKAARDGTLDSRTQGLSEADEAIIRLVTGALEDLRRVADSLEALTVLKRARG